MESALTRTISWRSRALTRVDGVTVSTWALVAGLILYLGFSGGGYDLLVSSQVGLILWWIVLIGAAAGILPMARLSRAGWAGAALFTVFVAWTALGATWSISSDRSLQDLARLATYLSVLLLALAVHRDRERAVRQTVRAAAAAIAFVCLLAVISRLLPNAFPAAHATGAFLGGAVGRLSWPLNYWNGLAALCALGLPLLLSEATSAERVRVQMAAAAAIPVVGLCAYLTFSRGGAVESAFAVGTFLALAPDRLRKLPTLLISGAGAAILIVAAHHRTALDQGLSTHAASSQGHAVLLALALVCLGVAMTQAAIGLAVRHTELPRVLQIPVARARILLGGGIVLGLVVALAVHVPHRLSNAWQHFKSNGGAGTGTGRFGSVSGEGRYDYWKVGLHATANQRLHGSGPGTFQLLWLPHASFWSPIVNAHSLYVETLAELGVVGLALLVGFFVLLLTIAVRTVIVSAHEARARAAAVAAAMVAFLVSASVDWVWQLPVLPAVFLLLAAAILAPVKAAPSVRSQVDRVSLDDHPEADAGASRRWRLRRPLVLRGALGVLAAACLIGIAIPYAVTSDVRASQNAASVSDTTAALADARSAIRLEPGSASAQLQLALVLELRHQLPDAIQAATAAIHDEPQNWSEWLVRSRLDAESGRVSASVADYRQAEALNPKSPVFTS